MNDYTSLHCYYCTSLILQLPKNEVQKLNGLSFECECCGHNNHLTGFKFSPAISKEISLYSKKAGIVYSY